MILRRCAWHRQYHGRTKIFGVASWTGWGIVFSDGMCFDCSARTRAEWSLPPATPRPSAVHRIRESLRPDFALATWLLVAAVAITAGVVVGSPPSRRGAPSPVNIASVAGVSLPVVTETAPTPPASPRAADTTASPRTIAPDGIRRLRRSPAPRIVHAAVERPVSEPVPAASVTQAVFEPIRAIPIAAIATPPVDVVVRSAPAADLPAPAAPLPSRWLAAREDNQQAP